MGLAHPLPPAALCFFLQLGDEGGIFPDYLVVLAETVCSSAEPVTGVTLPFIQERQLQFILVLITSLYLAYYVP